MRFGAKMVVLDVLPFSKRMNDPYTAGIHWRINGVAVRLVKSNNPGLSDEHKSMNLYWGLVRHPAQEYMALACKVQGNMEPDWRAALCAGFSDGATIDRDTNIPKIYQALRDYIEPNVPAKTARAIIISLIFSYTSSRLTGRNAFRNYADDHHRELKELIYSFTCFHYLDVASSPLVENIPPAVVSGPLHAAEVVAADAFPAGQQATTTSSSAIGPECRGSKRATSGRAIVPIKKARGLQETPEEAHVMGFISGHQNIADHIFPYLQPTRVERQTSECLDLKLPGIIPVSTPCGIDKDEDSRTMDEDSTSGDDDGLDFLRALLHSDQDLSVIDLAAQQLLHGTADLTGQVHDQV